MFNLKALVISAVFIMSTQIGSVQNAVADDSLTAKEALALEIIQLTNADAIADMMGEQIKHQTQGQIEAMISCPAQQEVAEEMIDSMATLMTDLIRSSDLQADLVLTYAEVFSLEELQGLVDFYRSEIGQKFVAAQPEIMRRSMQASQKFVAEMQAEMRHLFADTEQRLREAEASCEQGDEIE